MTDKMTADRNLDELFFSDADMGWLPRLDSGRIAIALTDEQYRAIRQALTAPSVPDVVSWIDAEIIKINDAKWGAIENHDDDGLRMLNTFSEKLECLLAMLTTAPAPAEPTISETFERIGREIKIDDAKIIAMVDARYDALLSEREGGSQ
jgi:hypothetical protein